jgi:hypothetical protein
MLSRYLYIAGVLLVGSLLQAAEPMGFDTGWIPANPEVLTYSSTSKQGTGLYQVSLARVDSIIEIYMNIITDGFTKSVFGTMTGDMRPKGSQSRIIVNHQVSMTTDCVYGPDSLKITTLISPYHQFKTNTLPCSNLVVDFSQISLLIRTLPLKPGAEFAFTSLNPQNNTLVPLTIRVLGEETIKDSKCYKVEQSDFEGTSLYWVELQNPHRVLRVEQPGIDRLTELRP